MSSSDEWRTPQDLFDALNEGKEYMGMRFDGFHFDIDLCATKENSKLSCFYIDYLNNLYNRPSILHNVRTDEKLYLSLEMIYKGDREHFGKRNLCAFMNPPYSNPKPFIEKAWEDSNHCKIVCLVKCDPSTKWWATFWHYGIQAQDFIYHGPMIGCEVIFFPKRIKFDPPLDMDLNCERCGGTGNYTFSNGVKSTGCYLCNNTGKKKFSGPTFPCALIIMDRRNV